MSNYKIIVTDLDGTLLSKPGYLDDVDQRAMEEIVARGVMIVPCTGRTIVETPPQVRDNPLFRYYIQSDGAVVYDKKTKERINLCMSMEDSNLLFDIFNHYTHKMRVRFEGNVYQRKMAMTEELFARFDVDPDFLCAMSPDEKLIENFEALCRKMDGIEMVSSHFSNDPEMERFFAELDSTGRFSYVRNEMMPYCHVFSNCAGKGNALNKLREKLHFSKEETICVGDGTNDITMLRAGGLKLAVANACEELRAEADKVICSNRDHIMPYILEHFIK